MKNTNVRLRDVAERAGMSTATASRALRGFSVHKKFRGKAEAAAAELGYVLNEAARSLRSVRTMTVGMIYYELTSLLGMELLGAITAGLDEAGYSVFVSTAQGKSDRYDKLVNRFLQRRVDALVCVHSNGDGDALDAYEKAGIPVMALITKRGGYGDLPLVGPTIRSAASECLAKLRALGHQNIVVLAPQQPAPLTSEFIALARARRLKLSIDKHGLADEDMRALLKTWMTIEPRPTAVVAFQADAVKLQEAASALRIKVPADLSIVAIRDRTTPLAGARGQLSMIHLDPRPMGLLAAETLRTWLVDDVPLLKDRHIDIGSWIERDTTGPARQ